MIYFPDDPVKQEMLDALIDQVKHYNCDRTYRRCNAIIPIIEKATGKSIKEVIS